MPAAATSLFLFLEAFVSILIVDFSRARRRQDFVGFRDVDKFLLRSLIAASIN
jgi:hypothetical protein